MRRFIITALILILSSSARAEEVTGSVSADIVTAPSQPSQQADDAPPASGEKHRSKSGSWYIAPTAGVTTVSSHGVFEAGVRGSWRFNRRFGLGFAGYGWAGASDDEGRTVNGGYSGIMFEYVFNPGAAYQVATANVIGGGGYCTERKREACTKLDGFFASDTTLNLEHQLVEHLRIAVGAGYRFAQTGHGGALSSEDLRGFVGRVSFQIGEM